MSTLFIVLLEHGLFPHCILNRRSIGRMGCMPKYEARRVACDSISWAIIGIHDLGLDRLNLQIPFYSLRSVLNIKRKCPLDPFLYPIPSERCGLFGNQEMHKSALSPIMGYGAAQSEVNQLLFASHVCLFAWFVLDTLISLNFCAKRNSPQSTLMAFLYPSDPFNLFSSFSFPLLEAQAAIWLGSSCVLAHLY